MTPIMLKPMFDNDKMETAIRAMQELIQQGYALSLNSSGGKDSSICTILGLEAIRRTKISGFDQATHYISSAETTIENPPLLQHLIGYLGDIEQHCAKHDLPVQIHVSQPSLASQFVVSTIGRGTLVRTVQNSVKDGKSTRACSDDWKIQPQLRRKKVLMEEAARTGHHEPVSILGTRFSESTFRSGAMTSRGESATTVSRAAAGDLTLSPLAHWDTDDVWWALSQFTDEKLFPFPSPVSARTINRMHDLYREANEGTCGVVLGEGGNKAVCNSRFGCAFCCISGDTDKSMESMIREPKHSHLAGLNQFRNYLMQTQWDMTKRELVGRTLSAAGYLRIQPDVYSFEHRIDLLRYLLTLDALEAERAERHTDDLDAGRIEDNDVNRELCDVQFEMINPRQLIAIDFQLSMHHYAQQAFPAVSEWFEIRKLGRRYPIPAVAHQVEKATIPAHGWFRVGNFDHEVPTDGLRDYEGELWNRHLHPGRVSAYAQTNDGERVTYFEETDQLTVDALDACAFVTCSFDAHMYGQAQHFPAIDSARFWLNEGILKLPKGKIGKYQHMARRGQYFSHLLERLNLTPDELDQHLVSKSISDKEHSALLATKGGHEYSLFDQVDHDEDQQALLL